MNDDSAQSQAQERLQEIFLKYVEGAEAGTAPDPKSVIAAHPEFAEELAEFLANYQQLNRLAAPLRIHDARHDDSEDLRSGRRAVPVSRH